ncbi:MULTISPECIES: hypothetical protein [Microbacterium]|nr:MULTISPECIES: hypothetical protein [Microbacterium]
MSTSHSPQYLRRRTIVRTIFWTPITLLGFGMIAQAVSNWMAAGA